MSYLISVSQIILFFTISLPKTIIIFISPIFHNPKNKNFLEIVKFNNLNLATNIDTIALGGINEKNLRKLKSTKVIGFAGISWIKKTGLKLIRPV